MAVKLNGKPSPISAVLDTFERVGNDNRDAIVVHCQKKMEINHVKVEILNEPMFWQMLQQKGWSSRVRRYI